MGKLWRVVSALFGCLISTILHATPLEAYGRLPNLEDVSLSPDGSRIAFVRTTDDARIIAVVSLKDGKMLGGLRAGQEKVRAIEWADNDRLLIETSTASLPIGLIGAEHEWVLLQVYDVVKHKTTVLPQISNTPDAKLMNVVAGRIMVRRIGGHTVLFIPGIYVDQRTMPALIRFELDDDSQKVVRFGSPASREWLVDDNGDVIAEQNYFEHDQRWALKTRRNGRLDETLTGQESIDYPRVLGFGPVADTVLIQTIEQDSAVWRLLSLKDGSLGMPMEEARKFSAPIEDRATHRMIGGMYVDDARHYQFFEKNMQARWDAIVHTFDNEYVQLVSRSDDSSKVIVRVEGAVHGLSYELIDFTTHSVQPLGNVYDSILHLLETRRIAYVAKDGLKISAFLTLPSNRESKNLPLVVLPHGGPAVRDTLDFDWWSQALADQGYAVLRPNYRGSASSRSLLAAGYGEWGRKMQTDLSDGVRYLVKEGIADASRVCIMGGSYGGYAALAGATLDPESYRCAISVAGPGDLKLMLNWVNEKHLERSSTEQRYWDRFMGVNGPNDPALDAISPIKHIDVANVPIMLIHGHDDTVVPFEQSDVMFKALKRANKKVELVTLKNEDHWLSRSDTRLQMLQAAVTFLRANNPPD